MIKGRIVNNLDNLHIIKDYDEDGRTSAFLALITFIKDFDSLNKNSKYMLIDTESTSLYYTDILKKRLEYEAEYKKDSFS